jgi:CDP-glucose 4,6-dehydratase
MDDLERLIMFNNVYNNKTVLITGHTGFKGSWLTTWLLDLGARVVGISKDIPTIPSMFQELGLEQKIKHYRVNICDFDALNEVIKLEEPDFIFHLAAQAIVSTSYLEPLETISSNVMGTLNVLESLRVLNIHCSVVIITSDKAYDNVEQVWGYKENDVMGGKDIYSGSKGAAELIIKSYYHSFFKLRASNVRLSVARAGNVIGGGDWAQDRIVPDAMTAWSQGKTVEIRSPNSTRPWQHVLEPLSGYLTLGEQLFRDIKLNGEGFNFGPRGEQSRTVHNLLVDSSKHWNIEAETAFLVTGNILFHEAGLLKLNCDKANFYLNWHATLEYSDTIKFTSEWYYCFYSSDVNMFKKTLSQIQEYECKGKERGLTWTE